MRGGKQNYGPQTCFQEEAGGLQVTFGETWSTATIFFSLVNLFIFTFYHCFLENQVLSIKMFHR